MNRLFVGLLALALASISLLPSVEAQTPATGTRAAGIFRYDVSQEVTLRGTVSSVLAKPSTGMIMGSHLLLTTPTGRVDASLGTFGLRGKGAMPAVAGQQVELTGVMKTIRNKEVFLVRSAKVNGQVFMIRNDHGFPVSPQARKRTSAKTTQKQGAL